MEIGIILLLLAALLCALDASLLFFRVRFGPRDRLNQVLTIGSACTVWGSLLLLSKYIFENNFAYQYVIEYSKINLSAELKLSALWAGQQGSLLLWTALIFLFYVLFKRTFTGALKTNL